MHFKTTRELSKTKIKRPDFLVLAAYRNALLSSSGIQLSKDSKAKDEQTNTKQFFFRQDL